MSNPYSPFLLLVIKYNALLHRYSMRLTQGNFRLSEDIVKEAMEETYDEDRFYDTPQLRSILKNKVLAKAKLYTSPLSLN